MPSEIHVYNLFLRCGPIERLRVLRDRLTHQPLGSALVLFTDARSAASALQYIHSGAVPGAIADFWLPRTLLRGPESGQSAGPSDGWTAAAQAKEMRGGQDAGEEEEGAGISGGGTP
jgi:RNA recognition motif-containing protein